LYFFPSKVSIIVKENSREKKKRKREKSRHFFVEKVMILMEMIMVSVNIVFDRSIMVDIAKGK